MSIGERIKKAREGRGLSQRQLASRLYIHPSTLNLIEHDKQRLTDDRIIAICNELQVSPNELFGWSIE